MIMPFMAKAQSIADYLSPAFPTSLVANHNGDAVAWVFNKQGVRNVYYGFPESNRFVALTKYTEDDGVEINSLVFNKTDDKIYFVKGNTVNTKGEPANPAQLQYSTEQTIFCIDLKTQELKKIVKGSSPVLSPDDKLLVFNQGGKIMKLDLSIADAPPSVLFQSRGSNGHIQFNPQGTLISFVSNRDEHAFVGVYDLKANKVRFADPSTYVDADPVWSPEGTQLAFVRKVFVRHNFPFIPKTSAQPWQIRVVDLQSNNAQTIFTADKGMGSVFVEDIPASSNPILWTKDNHIVFPWEKTGWVHLYSVEVNSKKVQALTTGNGEVESLTLAPDNNTIYFVSNIGDSNRRHVYKVDCVANHFVNLTPGKGIEYAPVVLKNGIAMLQATSQRPSWPVYLKNNQTSILAEHLFPDQFPKQLSVPSTILITAKDKQKAPAQIFLPSNYDPSKKYPAVIFLHGGSRRQMLEGFNYSSYYSNAYAVSEYFAQHGYIAMQLNYRSGIGYGLNFREAPKTGMAGGAEVNDLIAAGEYLATRKDVDAKSIAVWGGSYGGYLTAHALARRSDLFKVGVDIHGVHNWNDEEPTFAPWYDSLRYPSFAQGAYASSPMYFAKNWKSPVLFMHGDDDRNVPFTETIHMIHYLRAKGVDVEEKVLPDEIHGFLMYKSWLMVDEKTIEFINRKLKK
jgi:dipeptidyl aminopeptidase/acylaminoacyl peptidase